jgi:hypothetical protein
MYPGNKVIKTFFFVTTIKISLSICLCPSLLGYVRLGSYPYKRYQKVASRSRIFSHVRLFYEQAVSDLDP